MTKDRSPGRAGPVLIASAAGGAGAIRAGSRLENRWMDGPAPSQPRHNNKQPCKKHLHLWTVYKFTDIDLWPLAGPDIRLFRGVSFFLSFSLGFFFTVHILNIAALLELGGRQLGARPMTHGQEPRRDLCQGLGQKAAAGWSRDRLLLQKTPGLRGPLGEAGRGQAGSRAVWTSLLPRCVTFGKWLDHPKPQFPVLCNGDSTTDLGMVVTRVQEQCLTHS